MRLQLRPGQLSVNGRDVMLLHLAESKLAWRHSASVARLPAWAPPDPPAGIEASARALAGIEAAGAPAGMGADASAAPASSLWGGCVQADNLGWMNRTCGSTCSARSLDWVPTGQASQLELATRLARHRVVSQWAGHIKYAARDDEAASHAVKVGACSPSKLAPTRPSLRSRAERYAVRKSIRRRTSGQRR
jgi:hypothetical protein